MGHCTCIGAPTGQARPGVRERGVWGDRRARGSRWHQPGAPRPRPRSRLDPGDKGASTCPTPALRVTPVTAAPGSLPTLCPAWSHSLNGCLSRGRQCPPLSRGPGRPGCPQSPTDTALPAEASDPIPLRYLCAKQAWAPAATLPRLCPKCHRVSRTLKGLGGQGSPSDRAHPRASVSPAVWRGRHGAQHRLVVVGSVD